MVTITLNDEEAEQFKAFRRYQNQLESTVTAWREVIEFTKNLGSGNFTLTVQNGVPVRINNPMQTVVIGIKI